MKISFKIILFAFTVLSIVSCKKEDAPNITTPPQGLGGDAFVQSSVDKWIYNNLTKPYNVSGYYKWQPGQFPFGYEQIPPSEDQVIPVYDAIINVCFTPYNLQTGNTVFLQKYLPKALVLAGSQQYLSNGTVILGTAEGGTSITFFNANKFSRSKTDTAFLKQMVHTMHHEFSHILHQNVLYPNSFRTITGGYTGSWFNITDDVANTMGFVTAYAQASPDEDFVETISTMLTEGKTGFENRVLKRAGRPGSFGYEAIKAKEAVVVEYFQRVWKIDFYSLQIKTRAAYEAYLQ